MDHPIDNPSIIPGEVPGWGIDASEIDPAFPMRKLTGREHEGYSWGRPSQQAPGVEILQSNERPSLSAVYGTSCPPSRVSGMLRRFAFRYSESSYAHWLPLMLADRIGMLGGLIDDLGSGKVPNILDEKGLKADWRHDRGRLLSCAACGLLAGLMVISIIRRRER